MKQVIYDGFKAALAGGVPKDRAGILVDEQFGADILRDARQEGYITACPAEKSGQDEFDFEYGEDFGSHIEKVDPTFCKVLVRYNPEGDQAMNQRQAARLKQLSDYLQGERPAVHVRAARARRAGPAGSARAATRRPTTSELRPALMVRAIHELQDAGIEADVWKIEGLDRREDCEKVVAAARRGGRDKVGCIILGRGEDDKKVREWLTTAAPVPGFIGFAVGRTTFWDPLVNYRADPDQPPQLGWNAFRHGHELMRQPFLGRFEAEPVADLPMHRRQRQPTTIRPRGKKPAADRPGRARCGR